MNTRLSKEAGSLRLGPLIDRLSEIATAVEDNDARPEAIDQFLQGLSSLKRLKEKIAKLVHEHDSWQDVEDEMRLLNEAVAANEFDDLKLDWDERKCQIQGLYESPDMPWVIDIEESAGRLDEAIERDQEGKMKAEFKKYYRLARLRFFNVDNELRTLTREILESIGGGLSEVLAKLTQK